MWTVQDIREAFMDYFAERGHQRVDSWPLIPPDDPTLLFTAAGMVQFKPLYSGAVELPYTRACSIQKCLRAGGKGSDLENVGKTIRHHTFFEMLGNFSFGDYFKHEAIAWAWDFSTRVLGLPKDKLYVTIYEEDDEAGQIWQEAVGFPQERIFKMGKKDNFWGPAGDTGACGPCSEIQIDLGPQFAGPDDPQAGIKQGAERYLEFWNLVFPQFDQQKDGTRLPLKNRGIDTGMGLERLACILQGVRGPYFTNEMKPICEAAAAAIGVGYEDSSATMLSLNVIADHLRALTFVINEGVLPSNEGRGYVMRRILRRALRHGKKIGRDSAFLSGLVPVIVEQLSQPYPELKKNPSYIRQVIAAEEERFIQTLGQGMELLGKLLRDAGPGGTISGAEIFKLYDTYGFPPELTQEIAEEQKVGLDFSGFESALQKQKQRSKDEDKKYAQLGNAEELKKIFSESGATKFTGYDQLSGAARIIAVLANGARVTKLEAGAAVDLILDGTCFYAESGGQIGDRGAIHNAEFRMRVEDTHKSAEGIFEHRGVIESGALDLSGNREVRLEVDAERRWAAMRNHTATHLLQGALKRVVGQHVTQAGSYVAPEGLRFDFTHLEALTPEQVATIEQMVTEQIVADVPVETQIKKIAEAKAMGALAVFGEKYGEIVRVVRIGEFSKELCGGTHLQRTGQTGPFIITSESSVASGVRRIEALTGEGALEKIQREREALRAICRELSVVPEEARERVSTLSQELKQARKELQRAKQARAADEIGAALERREEIGGALVLIHVFEGLEAGELRAALDRVKSQPDHLAFLCATNNGKVNMICAVGKKYQDRVRADELIRAAAAIVGGGGGGRPEQAQAGGKDPAKLPAALERVREILREKLAT